MNVFPQRDTVYVSCVAVTVLSMNVFPQCDTSCVSCVAVTVLRYECFPSAWHVDFGKATSQV